MTSGYASAHMAAAQEWSVEPAVRVPRLQGLFDRRTAQKVATPIVSRVLAGAGEPEPGLSGRQVAVQGYEFDVKELEHLMTGFGRVERIEVTRKPALDLGKDHLDVNAFIGRRPKNLRGSRKVDVVKAAQQPPERSGFPIARSIPKALHASDKALSACFSLVFKQLTTEHRDNLMQSSYRVSPRSGDELILEGSDINWLFVVVSGVYQVFSTVLGKEMLLGSISGSGQVLGERDFLLRQHAQALLRQDGKALRHSVTVVADDDCSVVAVPVALLEQCLAETSFEEDLEALLDARATIHQIISRGPACAGKAPIASLLTSTELQFVVDCAGIVMYDEGETLHDRPELTECVTAIIIEGELEMERHHTARGDQEVPALALGHDKHQGKHQGKMIMLPGDDLYEVVKACKMIRSGTLVDSYKVVAVEMTKILYVRMEDIAPILTTNYALRKLIQDGGRDVVLQAQYHFYFFPWMRNLEWRVFNLGISRRVGQESWNDVEDAELQVYWNRIAEHLPQDDWLPMLSDHDVIVTFFTKEEAVKVVQELDKSWAARFASVRIAGAEGGYGALVRRVTTRIRECGALEPDLRDIYEDLVAMGIQFDRQVWCALLLGFNACRPLPIDIALRLLQELSARDCLDSEVLRESIDEWCLAGQTRSAAEFLDRYAAEKDDGTISTEAYLSTVYGWIRQKDPQMALASVSSMWVLGMAPDIDLMHSLIALLIYVQQIDDAVQVLKEMEACSADEGACPTKQTYLLVISGLTMVANGDEISSCIKRMQQFAAISPDTTLLNFLVEARCISGAMDEARSVVNNMGESWGCEPDEDTYSILGAGLIMAGMPEEAAKLLVSVGTRGYDSSKVDLNKIVLSWKQRRWRQAKGFEVELPNSEGHGATRSRHGTTLRPRERQHGGMLKGHSEQERTGVNTTSVGIYNKISPDVLLSVGAIQEAMASDLSFARRDFEESQLNASRHSTSHASLTYEL